MKKVVEIQNGKFVFENRPLRLTGLGVGSWLCIEHYMVGMPGTDGMIREALEARCPGFVEGFREAMFCDADAAYLRSLGVNFIRVPVNWKALMDGQTGEMRPEGFRQLRRLGEICDRHGLFFMPDLHAAPGGQNPDWHSECEAGTAQFWKFGALRDQACALWREMARTLKDFEYLLGYDLLNEPVLPDGRVDLLNDFHAKAAKAIREVDEEHILLIEGGRFAMDFTGVTLPEKERCAYTYHFYPTVWDGTLFDADVPDEVRLERFRSAHNEILSTMQGYDGPLLCGETGPEILTPGEALATRIQEQTIDIFDECGASWCMWCYKDTGMIGLAVPSEDTAWQKLARTVGRRWHHHTAMRLGDEEVRRMGDAYFGGLDEDTVYRAQFVLRAMWFPLEVQQFLVPALAGMTDEEMEQMKSDFRLERCSIRELYEAVLRRRCAG